MFTKIELAQFTARQLVRISVISASIHLIEEHTDADRSDIPVKVGTVVLGEMVGQKTDAHTDALVETLAAWIKLRKDKTTIE